jgi:VanZ family protein
MSIKLMLKVCSVAVLFLLVLAALGPEKWVPRSGLGWRIDHFFGYFALTLMFCFIWGRPFLFGGALMAAAVLSEGLQAFTPDRHANLHAALYSAAGVLAGALCADLFIRRAPRLLTAWTFSTVQPFRLLGPAWNAARAALVTASGRARLFGNAVARVVAPQSRSPI